MQQELRAIQATQLQAILRIRQESPKLQAIPHIDQESPIVTHQELRTIQVTQL